MYFTKEIKGALHLCTDEMIQVGSPIWYTDPDPKGDDWSGEYTVLAYDNELDLWTIENERTATAVKSSTLCVVIGLISPDATWAKAGEEIGKWEWAYSDDFSVIKLKNPETKMFY